MSSFHSPSNFHNFAEKSLTASAFVRGRVPQHGDVPRLPDKSTHFISLFFELQWFTCCNYMDGAPAAC